VSLRTVIAAAFDILVVPPADSSKKILHGSRAKSRTSVGDLLADAVT